jgi:hypothetical protein
MVKTLTISTKNNPTLVFKKIASIFDRKWSNSAKISDPRTPGANPKTSRYIYSYIQRQR